jgi:hypothetical protein
LATAPQSSRRFLVTAFLIGFAVHGILLALAFLTPSLNAPATLALLIVALPGAIIDISAEMTKPKGVFLVLWVILACCVNGAAYLAVAKAGSWLKQRLRKSQPKLPQ